MPYLMPGHMSGHECNSLGLWVICYLAWPSSDTYWHTLMLSQCCKDERDHALGCMSGMSTNHTKYSRKNIFCKTDILALIWMQRWHLEPINHNIIFLCCRFNLDHIMFSNSTYVAPNIWCNTMQKHDYLNILYNSDICCQSISTILLVKQNQLPSPSCYMWLLWQRGTGAVITIWSESD
jgi:hypothetical protein